jgi:hypothetical protein
MTFPAYPSINPFAIRAIAARLSNRKRSLRADSLKLCGKLTPPIRYTGLENLPAGGPLLMTTNHYSRPGFNTAWIAIGISAALPVELTWVMSNEWLFEGNPFAFILRPAMRFVLRSLTLAYHFLPMPTMIPGFSTPQQRSSGVRQVIERLRTQPETVLGLTPEGMDIPGGGLGLPPAGAGKFILYLCQMGLPIMPVGVCEHNGCLEIRFGQVYSLTAQISSTPKDLDLAVRQQVMEPIRALLE